MNGWTTLKSTRTVPTAARGKSVVNNRVRGEGGRNQPAIQVELLALRQMRRICAAGSAESGRVDYLFAPFSNNTLLINAITAQSI